MSDMRIAVVADAFPGVSETFVTEQARELAERGHDVVVVGEVPAAPADVLAGVELRPPLADDDRAGGHLSAVEHLDAEALGGGVPPVPGGPATLGLGHGCS